MGGLRRNEAMHMCIPTKHSYILLFIATIPSESFITILIYIIMIDYYHIPKAYCCQGLRKDSLRNSL